MLTFMDDDYDETELSNSKYLKNKPLKSGTGLEGEKGYPSTFYHTPPTYGDEQFLNDDPLLSSTNEVESALDNPTPYHLKENQRRQLQQYMSTQIHSTDTPNTQQQSMLSPNRLSPKSMTPDTPLSPDDLTMNFGSFEIDSILETISSHDNNDDNAMNIDIPINSLPSSYTYSSTVPSHHPNMMPYFPNNSPGTPNFGGVVHGHNPSVMSCPAHLGIQKQGENFAPLDMKQYTKDRQKKDNHNAIERRRRFNINDRIKELGTLLPKQDPEIRPNKGTILKSSVDYIQSLQGEQERMYKEREAMCARIAQLENCLRKHGISEGEWPAQPSSTDFRKNQNNRPTFPVKIKQEPEASFFGE